jgi:hypothetical protein
MWGSCSGDCEEYYLLGCDPMSSRGSSTDISEEHSVSIFWAEE